MGIFFVYILKSSVCLTIFYLFYKLLLSRDTFHRFNRIALLSLIMLSVIIPFCEITLEEATAIQRPVMDLENLLAAVSMRTSAESASQPVWLRVMVIAYIIGGILTLCQFAYSFYALFRLMRQGTPKLVDGIQVLAGKKAEGLQSGHDAALAIMTTDTVEKEMAVEIEIGGKTVTIGGMSKGSGMIHPNMCTMLAFITTDAAITKEALQKALSEDVEDTYNMISVDGDTSTNDTAILLANGLAGNQEITYASPEYETFKEALHMVNETLAKKMAGDGEGATALFEVKVVGAESIKQAKTLAKSVVCSNLTKAAIAGHDANWGRILCAMGYSGVQFDPEKVDLFFESKAGKLQIIENGVATDYSEEVATKILSEPEITATADIKMGDYSATAWGCDLTHEYININADYRS